MTGRCRVAIKTGRDDVGALLNRADMSIFSDSDEHTAPRIVFQMDTHVGRKIIGE